MNTINDISETYGLDASDAAAVEAMVAEDRVIARRKAIDAAAHDARLKAIAATRGLNGWSAERKIGRAIHLAILKEMEKWK